MELRDLPLPESRTSLVKGIRRQDRWLVPSGLLQVTPTVGDLGADGSQLSEVGVSPVSPVPA